MRVHTPTYRERIDAAAEAEGEAAERLAELLDEPTPPTRLQRARAEAEEAARLGLPPVKFQRYARGKAVRAWLRVCDALHAGRIPAAPSVDWQTSTDRARYAARRKWRERLLLELAPLRGGRRLSIAEARDLLGMTDDGFAKVLARQDVPRVRTPAGVCVRLADVRSFLKKKLQPRRLAAAA